VFGGGAWPSFERARASRRWASLTRPESPENAVEAALRLPWSNGMVEGVHRLKLLKRQMYGRAGFDLLRLRVLQPA